MRDNRAIIAIAISSCHCLLDRPETLVMYFGTVQVYFSVQLEHILTGCG